MKKHILFIVTEDWYFISHRINLGLLAIKQGYRVSLACNNTGKFKILEAYGFNCYRINSNRGSVAPLALVRDIVQIIRVIRQVKPDLIHLISMRPIALGSLGSFLSIKTPMILTFTGLGFIFLSTGFKGLILRVIMKLYLYVIAKSSFVRIVTQNKHDAAYLSYLLKYPKENITIIRGSGIDLNYFNVLKQPLSKPLVLAYVGRMLKDKGIENLVKAFELAIKNYPNLLLILAGSIDEKNPTSITRDRLKEITNINNIKHLGEVEDIRNVWKISHIAVLASKREGLPMSLMEAAACGRAIIASDVPGCTEVAINNKNALTFPYNDADSLSKAIIKLATDYKLRIKYSKESRKIVESDMDQKIVCKKYISMYEHIFSNF